MEQNFIISPQPQPSLQIFGKKARFPVNRIFCVGRNYADHAREMGSDPDREPPFFFSKPASSLVEHGSRLAFPKATENLHFEAELGIAIGKNGSAISTDKAPDYILGYAAALDMTCRDLQAEAKKHGRPWDMAKGFDESCPVGPLHLKEDIGLIEEGFIRLKQNGEIKQDGRLENMIWSPVHILAFLSELVHLRAGDLVLTGTPSGVGPVMLGDELEVVIENLSPLRILYV
jgi:fumarylpyruvate hydrolase